MARAPCCDKANVKKGPWSPEEDAQLKDYIQKSGTGGNWISLPQKAGLKRCGKSCRLRWLNYLRPNIKHGEFSDDEDRIICSLYSNIGSRWSIIASRLPGRTDNDIKNYWNTKLKKKLLNLNPNTSYTPLLPNPPIPYPNGSNYHNTPTTLSFSTFDQSTLLSNSSNRLPAPPLQSNYLVFGGAPEPSCSSSDGTEQQQQLKKGSFCNGSSMEDWDWDQKMGLGNGFLGFRVWEEEALAMEDGLEEIRQLISSDVSGGMGGSEGDLGNFCGGEFGFDEKSGERVKLYY